MNSRERQEEESFKYLKAESDKKIEQKNPFSQLEERVDFLSRLLFMAFRDYLLQFGGHAGQFCGSTLTVAGTLRGAFSGLRHTRNIVGNLSGSPAGIFKIPTHFICRSGLFFHRTGNGVRNIIDLVDDFADFADG